MYVLQCTPDDPGQSGREDADPPHAPTPDLAPERLDHDTLVEYVRSWAIFRLKATGASLRELEEETDVAKSSIDKFVKRQALPSKIWPKLRVWFLKDRHARYASLQDSGEMALLILESLANLPSDQLAAALLRTADHYEELHRQARAPYPEWIEGLRSLARDGLPGPTAASPEYPVPRRRGRKKKDPDARAPGHRPDPRDEE